MELRDKQMWQGLCLLSACGNISSDSIAIFSFDVRRDFVSIKRRYFVPFVSKRTDYKKVQRYTVTQLQLHLAKKKDVPGR